MEPSSGMSLVPYSSRDSRDIVLRHERSIVIRDPYSKQLVLREDSDAHAAPDLPNLSECPLCHQSIRTQPPDRDGRRSQSKESFVSPEYFRMLNLAHAESEHVHSPPSSPIRRLVQPAYPFPRQPTVSRVEGAEFVGSIPSSSAEGQGIRKDSFSPNYYKKFFTEEKVLGKGGKGVVYLVKHMLDGVSLGDFACKRVPVGNDHAWLEKVLIEVQLLQSLSHPNLVSYRHVWLEDFQATNFGPSIPYAFILQQYCNAGDLLRYVVGDAPVAMTPKEQLKERRRSRTFSDKPQVKPTRRKLKLEEIYSFFKDITSGLAHLHASNYIHRDLKPSNCLLNRVDSEVRCLISDFGEVQLEHVVRNSTGATGTISYCAPEVLRCDSTGRYGEFTTKSDVFSLGMILYFMCFGRLPYSSADAIDEEMEDMDLLRAEISTWSGFHEERKERPDLPAQLYEFLTHLLALDPVQRPSAAEILQAISSGSNLDAPSRMSRGSITGDKGLRIAKRFRAIDSSPSETASNQRSSSSAYIEDVNENDLTSSSKEADAVKIDLQTLGNGLNEQRSQLRLLPPPNLTMSESLLHSFTVFQHQSRMWIARNHQSSFVMSMRLLIFFTKMSVIMQPCRPAAPNSWIVFPLMLLATFDLSSSDDLRWEFTGILAAVHFVVVAVAVKGNYLCLVPRTILES